MKNSKSFKISDGFVFFGIFWDLVSGMFSERSFVMYYLIIQFQISIFLFLSYMHQVVRSVL
jgi:hypothetical protein